MRRLIDSLTNIDYRGFTVDMEVHLEGDYHPLVMQYVNNLTWPFGAYEIKKRNIKAGLETVTFCLLIFAYLTNKIE